MQKYIPPPLFSGARHWLNFKASFRMWLSSDSALSTRCTINGRESWLAGWPAGWQRGEGISGPAGGRDGASERTLSAASLTGPHRSSDRPPTRRSVGQSIPHTGRPASQLVRMRTVSRIAIKPHSDSGLKSSRWGWNLLLQGTSVPYKLDTL